MNANYTLERMYDLFVQQYIQLKWEREIAKNSRMLTNEKHTWKTHALVFGKRVHSFYILNYISYYCKRSYVLRRSLLYKQFI